MALTAIAVAHGSYGLVRSARHMSLLPHLTPAVSVPVLPAPCSIPPHLRPAVQQQLPVGQREAVPHHVAQTQLGLVDPAAWRKQQ